LKDVLQILGGWIFKKDHQSRIKSGLWSLFNRIPPQYLNNEFIREDN